MELPLNLPFVMLEIAMRADSISPFLVILLASAILLAPAGTSPASAETLALVGGTVIDTGDWGRSTADIEDAVVVVEDGKITAVGPRDAVAVPAGARVMDASGRYIVPGLVDGFAAINNQSYANAYLASGVTSIISVSGGRRGVLYLDADPGPEIYRLDSVGDERAALEVHLATTDRLAEEGVRILLVMYKLPPEQLQEVAARARSHGMGTIGELGLSTYEEGIEAGLDAFVHTTRYSLGMAPPEMARAVAEQPFSDDLDSPKWTYYKWLSRLSPFDERLESYANLLASESVALIPTFGLMYLDLPWARNPWKERVADLLDPADINRPADRTTGRHENDMAHQVAYSVLARSEIMLEEAYLRAGARFLAGSGTDVWGTMPGISLHQELESLSQIGMSPRQVLAAATSNFSRVFRSWGAVGEVRKGQRADLLVLAEDPRAGVEHLRSIEKVILAGTVIDPADLLRDAGRDGEILERRALPAPDVSGLPVVLEEITYSSDGLRVKGYLARPQGGGPHPCIVFNRGGNREFGALTPERAAGFISQMSSWGYAVVASQYRGNAGGEGQEEFGGAEVNDILNLIPLLESEPACDATRLGIYGGSRGGLMTYLTLARTDRFAGAVIRAGVSDLISWQEERPEMAEVFRDLIPGYDPADASTLLSRSPARWPERLSKTTPILMLHGTADWRVSPESALRMASALLESQHPVQLVLLPGSDHSLSEHQSERDRLTRDWFDRYVRDGSPLPDLVPHGD